MTGGQDLASVVAPAVFWTRMAEDGLLDPGVDLAGLIDTASILGGAETYLLITRMLGWDEAHQDYRRRRGRFRRPSRADAAALQPACSCALMSSHGGNGVGRAAQ